MYSPVQSNTSINSHFLLQQEIQSFNSIVDHLKNLEGLSSIQEPLEIIEKSFFKDLKLKHPRDIYPLYNAISFVTDEIAKRSLSELSASWEKFLIALDKRNIYRIGLGPIRFDTSVAQEILMKTLDVLRQSIQVAPIDLKNKQNYQDVVNYIFKTDREAFGACFQKGFLEEILKSDSIRCMAAHNEKNEIVGILWGFLTEYQGHQLFHFWELSRCPSMAEMGIAKQLIDCAKQQQRLYPNLKFATLNVDKENIHAQEIYDNEEFKTLNEEKEKVFMTNSLTSGSNIHLDANVSRTIVKKFVLDTVPLYKLMYYELARRCELIWKSCWYR